MSKQKKKASSLKETSKSINSFPPQQGKKSTSSKPSKAARSSTAKNKRRHFLGFPLKFWGQAILLILIGTSVLELIGSSVGDIVKVITPVSGLALTIFAMIKGLITNTDVKDIPISNNAEAADVALIGLRNLKNRLFRNSVCFTVLLLGLYLFSISALANGHAIGTSLGFIRNKVNDLISASGYIEDPVPSPVPSPSPSLMSPPILTPASSSTPSPIVEITPPQEFTYVRVLDPNCICKLSDEQYANLYYFSETYQILDWENEDEILKVVSAHVVALISQNKKDIFPPDTEVLVRANIAKASADERIMQTSDDLDAVITRRETVFSQFPFAEMASLLAENYNGYALAYYYIQGNWQTVQYYWAKSIFWYLEYLTFSNAKQNISSILNSIALRYYDLSLALPTDSVEHDWAHKLYRAYFALSNTYKE